jgi:phage tail-like protein
MVDIGTVQPYHKAWDFTIEIDGITRGGWTECSELKKVIETQEHNVGGNPKAVKIPHKIKIEALTLSRGAGLDLELYERFHTLEKHLSEGGTTEPYEFDFDIVQRYNGAEVRRWACERGWIGEFVAGAWDANKNEIVIEKMVVNIYDWNPVA